MRLILNLKLFLQNDERGISLIETVVALAILAFAGIAFLAGLTTVSQGVMVSQKSVIKENLAKSQMEYVKSQTYDDVNNPPQYMKLSGEVIPDPYDVEVLAVRLDPNNDGYDTDDGLQKITVTVEKNGEPVFNLSGYKVRQE